MFHHQSNVSLKGLPMALQANTNVASTVANFFADNYTALLNSSAAQIVPPGSGPTAQWLQDNADKKFALTPTGNGSYSLTKLSRDSSGNYPNIQPGQYQVDANVAYAIETAGSNANAVVVDWLMGRIADEFRRQATAQSFGPSLTSLPEPDLQFDLSSLDTATLVRLLNLITGRNKDSVAEVAKGNAQDAKASAARLGLAVANLSIALELQTRFLGQATQASTAGTFDSLTATALGKFTAGSASSLEGERVAYQSRAASRLDGDRLGRMTQIALRGLESQLQGAADIAYVSNPVIAKFLSDLDVQQNGSDGFVILTASAQERQAIAAALKADLQQALNDPALVTALADALAANADDLDVGDLSLPEQTALFREIAQAVVDNLRDDDAFLLAFLRARKYEVPRALKVLNTFCSFWSSNAHIIGARAAWRADTIHSCRAEAALTL
jgi:hypothetical protein